MSEIILDDIAKIEKIDKNKMIGFCVEAANHYKASMQTAQKVKFDFPKPENIIISGMGGSAIGGELLKDYVRATARVPVEINREYHLPAFADQRTLAILASYSGDTEETLSNLLDAIHRKCMIYCVSSGGALTRYAKKLGLLHTIVQSEMPPRAALPHMLMPLLVCAEKLGAVPEISDEFSEATALLEQISVENSPSKPAEGNFAKTLARHLMGYSPVTYGFGIFRGVALRFKQQFNENAKIPAKWDTFSELNHNETMGWEKSADLAKCSSVVFIRDKKEPAEIRSRIETTKTLMQPLLPKMHEVWAQGKGNLAKMLSTILVGDFTSVYLAYLRGVDPTPVNTVTIMKQKIEKNGFKKNVLDDLEKLH